ncbi:ABC transporter ATP-binding protein [Streptomyces sp. NPDC002054]|uniref:ABC transporter ATP-binding protein n=1 Tax=Streptomyces sp. NPDC002054 TaxID=3154663 RepID=UPI0033276FC5
MAPEDSYASLTRFFARLRGRVVLAALLITVNAAAAVLPAFIAQRLIDEGALRGDLSRVYVLGAALVAAGLLAAGSALGERWLVVRLAEDVTVRLRCDLFQHLQGQSDAFFSAARAGALVSRLSGDVQGVHDLIARTLRTAVSSLVTLAVTGFALFLLDWRIALAAAVLIPVVYALTAHAGSVLRGIAQRQLAATADLDSLAAEQLSAGGAETIRLFAAAPREATRFRTAALRLRETMMRGTLLDARIGAALTVATTSATAAVYVGAGAMVSGGTMSVGTLVAMASLLTLLYGPVAALPVCRLELVRGLVSFDRVREIMRFAPLIADRPGARDVAGTDVAFLDVAFSYPPPQRNTPASLRAAPTAGEEGEGGEASEPLPVLRNVTFTAKPGMTVAIVGGSGSGKSTLARLLTRSWEPTAGRIEVGGQDIADLSLHGLRRHIGVVTQEPFLFHGSIADNLRLARPDATDDQLLAACATAQAMDLVQRLPAGLDTVLGDRAVRLSGGERQRLAIARMLLWEPQIVVLDEATSHLDNATERALHLALRPFLSERTCLVIAHRLSTVRQADLILVLHNGEISEQGSHDQLVRHDGPYRRLLNAQPARQAAGVDSP